MRLTERRKTLPAQVGFISTQLRRMCLYAVKQPQTKQVLCNAESLNEVQP